MSATAEAVAEPGIRGFVDGLSGAQIDGWAFEPAHASERVIVELRLGADTLATTVADRHRADLLRAGVGDAFHGFRFALKPEWAERRADLLVVALGAEGGEAPLPLFQRGGLQAPPPNPQVVKAIEQLLAGQRSLDRRLEEVTARIAAVATPTMAPPPPEPPAPDADLDQRLAALESWVARLDDRLAMLAEAPQAAPAGRAQPDTWQVVLMALLVAFGFGSLGVFALMLAI